MSSTLLSSLHHQKSSQAASITAIVVTALAAGSSFTEAFAPPVALQQRNNGHIARDSTPLESLSLSSPSQPRALKLSHLYAATNGEDYTNGSTKETTLLTQKFDQALKDGDLRQAELILSSAGSDSSALPINDARWDMIFNAIEERTTMAEETQTENLRQLAEFPGKSDARTEMTDMYQALAKQDHLQLFGAVLAQEPVESSISSRSSLPPELLEEKISLPMSALTPQATNSILWAGVTLAVAEGLASMAIPGLTLNFLVLLTLFLTTIDRLFLNGAFLENYVKLFTPGMQQRIARHEAGHFLAAYLLGCPVEGVVLSAWEALQDDRFGNSRQVSAGTSFFDPQLSQQMNSGLGMPQQQQQQRQGAVTRSSIDRYSIIVMAGIAAEADYYGRADGGAGDEMALIAFLSQLNRRTSGGSSFPPTMASLMTSSPMPNQSWSPELIKNQARWGALQAVVMLREYKPAYEALVAVLEKPGPTRLCDCIRAIETAAKEHNLKPTPAALAMGGNTMDQQEQEDGLVGSSTNGINGAGASSSTPAPSSPVSSEEMATTLKEYRSVVEKRLREVEDRLDEIQQGKP